MDLIKKIFSIVINLISGFFTARSNKKVNKSNETAIKNEIKKVAKNAESKNEDVKQKAIDDMRKLISD